MKAGNSLPLDQHNREIQRNREAWSQRPQLREIYREFHRRIAVRLDPAVPGSVVELGSGIGSIKEAIPQCITTDLFPNPWLDRQENAYRLSFEDGSVSHLILFDVWHHLRYPGTALAEARRVLAPRGRLILFEPAISWASLVVYGLFHHEPIGLASSIVWDAPAGFSPEHADYYAAQGSATRLFWRGEARGRLDGWSLREVEPFASFEYFCSGGFSGPRIGGTRWSALMRRVDRIANLVPRAFAARLLVVLEKTGA